MAKAKKLPSGSWRVQASKTINGKLVKKSFTSDNKKEAEFLASQWQIEYAEQHLIEDITLHQAYVKYIEMKNEILSPSTILGYEALLRNTFKQLMNMPVKKITSILVQIEINSLAANHSAKYVHNAYGLLKAVLKTFAPTLSLDITLPQKTKPDLYIPDDNEIKILLESVKGKPIEIPILLAAFGPMRRSEICALTSDDINGNIVTVKEAVVKGKNGLHTKGTKTYSSTRQIEYPDFVIEKIKNINGKIVDMHPNTITDIFSEELNKCGLPHFRFHDLRHYAVSTLHSINVPDKYIMARGGWATNGVMQRVYNHVLQSKQDELTNKIIGHFGTVFNND